MNTKAKSEKFRSKTEKEQKMDKLTASRIAGGNTAYKREGSDYYPTPPEATQALINFLGLESGTRVWEPACGEGHMVSVLEKNGLVVTKSDLMYGEDFLKIPFRECEWIITNPPFSLSEQFIRRCKEYDRPFALLLKSQYWHAKKRLSIFRETHPSYICPLTWRPDFMFGKRGKGSPLMDVMWVVWDKDIWKRDYPLYIPLEKPDKVGGRF